MVEKLQLTAKKREIFGKKTRSLRKKNQIPAILYGREIKSQPLTIDMTEFKNIFKKAGTSTLVELKINNETKNVLIHPPQLDVISEEPIHVDFYAVKMTEKIETQVPIKFIGTAPAVKNLSGNLVIEKKEIKVKCLPNDLIHEIEVDISGLKTFDDIIYVKDIKVPNKIEILDKPEEIVIVVTPPRSEEELKELEEKVEEKIEKVEIVKEKKKVGEIIEEKTEISEKKEPTK